MIRIVLFLATNIAVLVVLTVVMKLLGLEQSLGPDLNLTALLTMAAVMGMTGSFISLALSKWMAKRSVGAQVIEQPQTPAEAWLVNTIARQAQAAGVGMPEVAIYHSPDINAFATGMNRDNALVAVSTGLLQNMTEQEVEAVLGHEISHVANGDMVTLALIQGVINTFVIFFSRIVGFMVDRLLSRDGEHEGIGPAYFVTSIIAEIVFGILATMIVMWFSRRREFRADAGGARLAGRTKMIAALERLRSAMEPSHLPDQLAAFGIRGGGQGLLTRLFMSHPPLEERINALRAQRSLQ
jgi:heat shock protein HtpX